MKDPFKILIADDNPENIRVLNEMLNNEFEIRVAKNGKQALTSIYSSEPDLVLLDIHMPKMNGFEVCKTLRKDQKYEDIPIIFLSALNDDFNKFQAFQSGASDYMTKPFDILELKRRIKTHLKLRTSILEIEVLKQQLKMKIEELETMSSKENE